MSLFGAMFTGVTGLNAQSKKIGSISDNIANVNTVGYKRSDTQFESLVITTTTSNSYTPGGVLANTRYIVDQQGLLVATNANTDLAISGSGFFIVKESNDGIPVYTRAGSFRANDKGELQNAQGYLLQGWPLDQQGRLPGEPGNLNTTASSTFESLETVNINKAGGQAQPTTTIDIQANLKQSEKIYPGAGFTGAMDIFSIANYGIGMDDIIASSEYGMSPLNNIRRGDQLEVITGNGQNYIYNYGGFTVGRQITVPGAGGVGDLNTVIQPQTLAGGEFTFTPGSSTVQVTMPAGHNLQSGATITLGGFANPTAGIPAGELNTAHNIVVTGPNTFQFNVTTPSTGGTNAGGETFNPRPFSGTILDANSPNQAFFTTTDATGFSNQALTFSVSTNTTGTKTFTYVTGSPSAAAGQFNSLTTLAAAIDQVAGLTARVVEGRLMVSSEDANEAVTFTNGSIGGEAGPPPKQGIDWVNELGLTNITTGSNRFNTLKGLYDLVQSSAGISASLEGELADSKLNVFVDDPLETIRIRDYIQSPVTALGTDPFTISGVGPSYTIAVADPAATYNVGDTVVFAGAMAFNGLTDSEINSAFTITAVTPGVGYEVSITPVAPLTAGAGGGTLATAGATNSGSLLAELGMVPSLNGAAFEPLDTGLTGPKYDASGVAGQNMASGDIEPQYSRQIRVYDAFGSGHDIRLSFLKVAENRWAVEAHVVPASDISGILPNGQIAVGFIDFNGDGSLRAVSQDLAGAINVSWTNGANSSAITVDWGTAGPPFGSLNSTVFGRTDGLRQYDDAYDATVQQDGTYSGYLVSVEVDPTGKVIASYSNGKSQALYQLPVADFANPNALRPLTGNIFAATQDSGDPNMRTAGSGGMGTVQSGSLESSNVDLATELTDMIVAQRAYQSNTRVIQTTNDLLQELTNLGR
jgi:flagellar hook-basal body protein